MVSMKNVVEAVNKRAKIAMALAGYKSPRCTSYNRESPDRPACRTMVDSGVQINPNGWFTRRFNVLIIFYPEDENKPHGELRVMDDCMVKAFCNPIDFRDDNGIRWVRNFTEDGIDQEISNGCLLTVMSYEFDFDRDSVSLEPENYERMETLAMTIEKGDD